jgi:branched-chain amino acid transport system substrate-binding protein
VALFTDTAPDGVAERPLYKAAFEREGLTLVGDYSFPVGTTDFSSFISDAKSKGAQLVVGQMVPPDGIALWKQMKALALQPEAAFVSKAAADMTWPKALADTAEGTLTDGLWNVNLNHSGSQAVLDGPLGEKYQDNFGGLTIAVLGYTVAQIATDALARAGTTDAQALNEAIGNTDADYAVGRIRFDSKNVSTTDYVLMQWQRGAMLQVAPSVGGAELQVPAAGLR